MEKSITQCELIPNRIIQRNNNYAQRKMLISRKFEWLNKYLSTVSPKIIQPTRFILSPKNENFPSKAPTKTRSRYKNKTIDGDFQMLTVLDFNKSCKKEQQKPQKSSNPEKSRVKTFHSSKKRVYEKKTSCAEQKTSSKFLRKRPPLTQFKKYKKVPETIGAKRSLTETSKIEDFQLKPWFIKIDGQDQDSFKENI